MALELTLNIGIGIDIRLNTDIGIDIVHWN